MQAKLKQIFEDSIREDNPNLKVLQERGLVRRDLDQEDFTDESAREVVIEGALIRYSIRSKSEQRELLTELGVEPNIEVQMAADQMMQPVSNKQVTLEVLEAKAREIWSKAMEPIRDVSADMNMEVIAAEQKLVDRDFKSVDSFLEDITARTRSLDEEFKNSFIEAKRQLRGNYTAEFGRVWGPEVTDQYNTMVDRTVFLPPEKYREMRSSVTDLQQNLVREQEYSTELRHRLDRKMDGPSPNSSLKP